MTPAEAIEVMVARTGHRRFRELCDPDHPDHDPGYIPLVVRLAEGPWPPPASPPGPRPDPGYSSRLPPPGGCCP